VILAFVFSYKVTTKSCTHV